VNRKSLAVLGPAALAAALALTSCKKSEPVMAAPAAPPPPAGAPQGMPPGMPPQGMPPGVPALPQGLPPPSMAGQLGAGPGARMTELTQAVAKDPKNVGAWVELGNLYFDTKQPQKAIDAYAKALELQPNNPDVITDQGVMYREIGSFDKAAANFKKANQIAPTHMQSLFNLGVVQAFDLKDTKAAVQTWNKVIATSPGSPQAMQARQAIDSLQQGGAPR
jgi:hypothetical protein